MAVRELARLSFPRLLLPPSDSIHGCPAQLSQDRSLEGAFSYLRIDLLGEHKEERLPQLDQAA
jgi:hypothetical protein